MLVVFAISVLALLAMIGALYTFGLVLSQRRGLQTAADAASLSGAWQLVSQLQSDDRSDTAVRDAVVRFATDNGLPSDGTPGNATYLSAEYVDASGIALQQVGSGAPVPTAARGVRVTLRNQVPTVLPGFVRVTQLQVEARAASVARATAPPDSEQYAMPIAIRLDTARTAFAARTALELLGGSNRVADLRAADAPAFTTWAERLQYWSDGEGANGAVEIGSTLPLAEQTIPEAIAAGLHDNVNRQGLRDGSGAAYALVMVPVWDLESAGTVRVAGFALVKIRAADISTGSVRGLLVPFAPAAWGAQPVAGSGSDVGPVLIGLTS